MPYHVIHLYLWFISLCTMFTHILFGSMLLLCLWASLSCILTDTYNCLSQILQLVLLMQMQAPVECTSIMDQLMALTPNQLRSRVIFLSRFPSLNLCPLISLPLSVQLCMNFHNGYDPWEQNTITIIKNREVDNLKQFCTIL